MIEYGAGTVRLHRLPFNRTMPNDQYMAFDSEHVNWGMKSQTEQFRHEIDSKDKAREYIKEHLSGQ